ncbi:MAG: EAL domain-containing protein [Pseudomonadota bacterium]
MSLMRQLWLTIFVSAVMTLAGSLCISIWSAQEYLSQQLERKNSDTATSLALSMTQQAKDPVTVDLQLAALFDTGYYQMIQVVDPLGKVISERIQDKTEAAVPQWFTHMFPVSSRPGAAQISDGWKQYGTVTVVSHSQFAYRALWEQAGILLIWFGVSALLAGVLGTVVLRAIGRSLNDMVNQAKAIGERRFNAIDEPRTPELRVLARAMNSMAQRIRQMFNEAAVHLEELRLRANYDQVTGLPRREYFMAYLKEQLSSAEAAQSGVLAIVRITDLNTVNEILGRDGTDALLRRIGVTLTEYVQWQEKLLTGRIKSGDIAIVLPGENDPHDAAQRLGKILDEQTAGSVLEDIYHLGAVSFSHGDNPGEVLSRVDHALALAEAQGANAWHAISDDEQMKIIPGEQWRTLLTDAVNTVKLKLEFYPVIRLDGTTLHQEGLVRLATAPDQPLMRAADFMPLAAHLHLTALIDLEVIRLALLRMANNADNIALNISAETIANWGFRNDLAKILRNNPALCPRLWFEVAEYGAFRHFSAFKDICITLKSFGCHVGVDRFGQRLAESERLTEVGLDYVKIHPGLVHGIETNSGNQELLKRFCGVAHSVGIIVLAMGVESSAELQILRSLGCDGASGSAVGS